MKKFSPFILFVCIFLIGCQTTDTSSENHYDRVSREIEKLKAEAQARTSTGDNIKVVINLLTTNVADYFAIDPLWQYVNQNIVIAKRPEIFTQSGLKIGLADKHFWARLDITKQQLKSSEDTELFIVLADGSTGYINIGEQISIPRFYYFGRWYTGVAYEFRTAGRSLKVTARKLPSGLIDMELTPVFSRFLSDSGDLELTELSTRVSAYPGQSVVLGGSDMSGEDVATALLSYSKEGKKKQTLIIVTPHIQ